MEQFIGYARISTHEQSLDMQMDALWQAGCDKIYTDEITGAASVRPGLNDLLAYVRPGDTIVIWRLDRLGRSVKHLVGLSEKLQAQNINLKSIQDGIDTNTAQGRLFFHMMASLAEFERDLIRERTRAGLKAAKARGRQGGRKPKLTQGQVRAARQMVKDGESVREVARHLHVSKSTLYRALARSQVPRTS